MKTLLTKLINEWKVTIFTVIFGVLFMVMMCQHSKAQNQAPIINGISKCSENTYEAWTIAEYGTYHYMFLYTSDTTNLRKYFFFDVSGIYGAENDITITGCIPYKTGFLKLIYKQDGVQKESDWGYYNLQYDEPKEDWLIADTSY